MIFEVLMDEAIIAWLNVMATCVFVAIEAAEVAGVMATIVGVATNTDAPVVNWDWNEEARVIPVEVITFEATCTLYEVYAVKAFTGVNVAM
jgi:hypothetical protein